MSGVEPTYFPITPLTPIKSNQIIETDNSIGVATPCGHLAAIAQRHTVHDLAFLVHTHPTLSEVLDEAYKRAVATH